MATDSSIIELLLEELSSLGSVRARKMFGEYALYCDEKVVALVCDDQLYVKFTDNGKKFAEGKYEEGEAYPGAKPSMRIIDFEDREFLCELVRITADALPLPKKKKHK